MSISDVSLSELINPTPRQLEAFKATLNHRFVLFGGAAGAGKSRTLRWWSIRELLRLYGQTDIRGLRVGLFSDTYGTLQDRQISQISREVPEWLGVLRETKAAGYNLTLHERFGAGTIALRNLDKPEKYKSTEFAAIAVEELTENVKETFDDLRFRLRWPGIERPSFLGATNPGGVGHSWCKSLWVDSDFSAYPELKPLAHEFKFIRALPTDNPHLPAQYLKDLESLPEDKRKAYLEGSWDLFVGQYFSEWRDEIHVIKPFTVPRYWKQWMACDWGFEALFVCLWIAQSPEGELFVTSEVSGTHLTVKDQAKLINGINAHRDPDFGVLDTACWDDSRGESIAQQFQRFGIHFKKSTKNRLGGWQKLRRLLAYEKDESGKLITRPRLQVFDNCRGLIKTLPSLVHDKHNVEDLDSKGPDHHADALRYGIMVEDIQTTTPLHVMHPDDADAIILAQRNEQRPYEIYTS